MRLRILGNLAPDLWGARTTRLRRTQRPPLVGQRPHVHRIPASRLVTSAKRPSGKRGGMGAGYVKSEILKTGIFFRDGLDSTARGPPVGQITCRPASGAPPSSRRRPGPIITEFRFAKTVSNRIPRIDPAVWVPASAGTTWRWSIRILAQSRRRPGRGRDPYRGIYPWYS